jgi:hypothetical protein
MNIEYQPRWLTDIAESVAMYNDWYKANAPRIYRQGRSTVTPAAHIAFSVSDNLKNVNEIHIPDHLHVLRACCDPPLSQDRLCGLADVRKGALKDPTDEEKRSIIEVLNHFINRATSVEVAIDRMASSVAVRNELVNAQERRQLKLLGDWLTKRGFTKGEHFKFRHNVREKEPKLPIDAVLWASDMICIECKAAGDFTNPNKRKKEDVKRSVDLKEVHPNATYIMMLCGYFDEIFLRYIAKAGIDWFWEHRMDDLAKIL